MVWKSLFLLLLIGCLFQSGCVATSAAIGETIGGGIGTAVGAVGEAVVSTVKIIAAPATKEKKPQTPEK